MEQISIIIIRALDVLARRIETKYTIRLPFAVNRSPLKSRIGGTVSSHLFEEVGLTSAEERDGDGMYECVTPSLFDSINVTGKARKRGTK
jgi:hypothetical protein